MTAKLIEEGWQEICTDNSGFCCETHREFYRMLYFSGAMNAIEAATTWEPGHPVEVRRDCLHMVCDELTIEAMKAQRESEGVGHA